MSQRYSLLPANASALERAFEQAFAEMLEAIDPPFPELLDPVRTPANMLPYLAQDRGVPEWDAAAPEPLKRRTVENVWPIRRMAGTREALTLAVDELDYDAEVLAWYDPKAYYTAPYHVEVMAWKRDGATIDADVLEQMERNLEYAKSERDVLTLTLALNLEVGFRASGAIEPGVSWRDDQPDGVTFDPPSMRGGLGAHGAAGLTTAASDDRGEGRIRQSPDLWGTASPWAAHGALTMASEDRGDGQLPPVPEARGTLAGWGAAAPMISVLDLGGHALPATPLIDLALPGYRLAGGAYLTLITDHYPRAQT